MAVQVAGFGRCENCGEKNAPGEAAFCDGCEDYFEEQRRDLDEETALGMGLLADGTDPRSFQRSRGTE